MKHLLFLFIASIFFIGCGDGSGEKAYVAKSSGKMNYLNVIMENEQWKGEIGEALRLNFAAPVDGLPQEEPIFSMNQMPLEAYSGFARNNRTFVKIEKGKPAEIKFYKDPFAKPQLGVVISGQTNEEIINLIEKNADNIIKKFKAVEITEKQRRISQSLKDDSRLEDKMGVSLDFPTAYRFAVERDDFFWIIKDFPHGSMEILIYQVPLSTFEKDTNVIGNIISMRDSIGQAYIPGPIEGSYMITEEAYAPYLFDSQIDGKFAYETKGTWEVKNAFMAGPFINYAVRDEKNNRYVILEGFTFRPSASKRDNMFELEAILRSAEIN